MMFHGYGRAGKAVTYLLIANIAVYVLQNVPGLRLAMVNWGGLVPSLVFSRAHVWRIVTYMFLHDPVTIWHLLFNMLALWMFGVEIEARWGQRRFLTFYFLCGICSGLFSVIMWNTLIIGASGAVLGVLTAYAFYFPDRRILMFFIFPVPARWAVAIIGFVSLWGSMGSVGGVAHLTHLGGIVVALVYLKYYNQAHALLEHVGDLRSEKQRRRRAEEYLRRERRFEEVIDPILKKVSEGGMESLTREEKKELQKASRTSREKMKKQKIVPFDVFKKL